MLKHCQGGGKRGVGGGWAEIEIVKIMCFLLEKNKHALASLRCVLVYTSRIRLHTNQRCFPSAEETALV